MSDFLLEKSLKLSQNRPIKKTKKAFCQNLKKKKNLFALKELEKEKVQENILKNLKYLQKLNNEISVDVPEEVLAKRTGEKLDQEEKSEEISETVFTDKDFEDFEKEYFGN